MFKDKGILKALWAGMFILCAVLGFVPPTGGFTKGLLVVLALGFFVPPFADLWFSRQRKDAAEIRLLRNLSLASLSLTLVLLVGNMLTVLLNGYTLGNILYYALVILSTPMICGQFWAYSLLLWSILLWCCITVLRKLKK
jgi:hypothetical protein